MAKQTDSEDDCDFDDGDEETDLVEALPDFGVSADGSSFVFLTLSMPCRGLTDLKGLGEQYVHVQVVDLQQNSITDLSPLHNMRHLVKLNVSHNDLTSLDDFRPPFGLRELNASYNALQEIPDVSEYGSLEKLVLDGNSIIKMENFSLCHNLIFLSLSHNKIRRIAGLFFPSLQHLDLSFNSIEKIENLDSVPSLTFLSLSGNRIGELSQLVKLKHLGYLDLEANAIENLYEIDNVQSLRHLRSVILMRNPIESLHNYREAVVYKLQQLSELDMRKVSAVEKVSAQNQWSPALEVTAALKHLLNVKQRITRQSFTLLDCTLPDFDTPYPMLILVGPKGLGKHKLAKRLVRDFPQYFGRGVCHTTRSPKTSETNEIDYYFVTAEEFSDLLMDGHFIETVHSDGHHFGLSYDSVDMVAREGLACVTCMSLEGVMSMKISHFQPRYVLVCPLKGKGSELSQPYIQMHQDRPGFFEQAIVSDNLDDAYRELKQLVLQFLALSSSTEPTPASTHTTATHGLAQVFSRPSSSATGRSTNARSALDKQLYETKLEQARAAAAGPIQHQGPVGRLAYSAPPSINPYPSASSLLTTTSNASQSQSLFSSVSGQQNGYISSNETSMSPQSQSPVET